MAYEGNRQRKPGFKTAVEDAKAVATVLAMEAESIFGRKTAQVLGVLLLFVVVIGLVLTLLNWYIDPGNARERKDLILISAQILGGTALASGLYFTWRSLQINREGQITERFTRAIDQLGASEGDKKKVETRMGGIYALERVAKESAEDYWPIMEILAAYVQQHAPLQTSSGSETENPATETENPATETENPATETENPANRMRRFGHKSPDVQACLTVIGRRFRDGYLKEPKRLNLQQTDLRFADLPGADLARVWFADVNLRMAFLPRANLRGTWLVRANVSRAFLKDAKLTEANLERTNLERANLRGADLRGADLRRANLRRTLLEGANLATVRNLTQHQVNVARGDQNTTLPPGLERPKHWQRNNAE